MSPPIQPLQLSRKTRWRIAALGCLFVLPPAMVVMMRLCALLVSYQPETEGKATMLCLSLALGLLSSFACVLAGSDA